ncbi:hypothetical protein OCU04_004997 [Sclerotinia nivalis]|uniref:Uncharacterized protein n=1 Tax=Sclerotinia nivalis TaxID=352851 RepID=A0A9X0DJI0_9HELO|nr:hypothetical protein OCU04_004997 [Sclerotinia nivalis]
MSDTHPTPSLSNPCPECGLEMEDPVKNLCEFCFTIPDDSRPPSYREGQSGQSSGQDNPSTSSIHRQSQSRTEPSSTGQDQGSTYNTSSPTSRRKREGPSKDEENRGSSDSNKRGRKSGYTPGTSSRERGNTSDQDKRTATSSALQSDRQGEIRFPPIRERSPQPDTYQAGGAHAAGDLMETSHSAGYEQSGGRTSYGKYIAAGQTSSTAAPSGHSTTSTQRGEREDISTQQQSMPARRISMSSLLSNEASTEMNTLSVGSEQARGPSSSEQQSAAGPSSSEQQSVAGLSSFEQQSAAGPSSSEQPSAAGPSSSEQQSAVGPSSSEQQSAAGPSSSEQQSAVSPSSSEQQSAAGPSSSEQQSAAGPSSSEQPSAAGPSSSEQQSAAGQTRNTRPPPSVYRGTTVFPSEQVLNEYWQLRAQQTGDNTRPTQDALELIIMTSAGEVVDLSKCIFWMGGVLNYNGPLRCGHGSGIYCLENRYNGLQHRAANNPRPIPDTTLIIKEIGKIRKRFNFYNR